jgi:hypothetical protein
MKTNKIHSGMLLAAALCVFLSIPGKTASLSKADTEYLTGVYKHTFAGIAFFVNEKTGLPYDVSDFRKATSISNIGLYMASVAVAAKTGIITNEEALKKLDRAMSSLEKIQKWNQFPVTWVNVETLERDFGPSFSYADHVGNLVCGLLVAEGVFPKELGGRIDAFISPMKFDTAYDPSTGWLKGGYNLDKNDFDIDQPWGKWYYNILASDTRHFSLIGIALGAIPESSWDKLNRSTDPAGKWDKDLKAGLPKDIIYYWPGIEGGGIFMQYLPGIFLPEKGLPMGQSAKNLALAQIEYAKKAGYFPMWGISASESPDGKTYLGWGGMRLDVVTPHASALAAEYFPQEAVNNLRALETKGMRPGEFGFTDAYDTAAGTCSKNYLILDQSMLFLSLANYLEKEVVRKSFEAAALGKSAVKTLKKLEGKRKLK